jgi:hypothetical protein
MSFELLPHTPSAFPLFLSVTYPALISCLELEDTRSEKARITHRVVDLLPFCIPAAPVPATITWLRNPLIPLAKTRTVNRPTLHPLPLPLVRFLPIQMLLPVLPHPSPHPGFSDLQRETINSLCKDNAEMKFLQELMEKHLDWLMDSGAQDPSQHRTIEELLQEMMESKWLDESEHAFPHSYTRK